MRSLAPAGAVTLGQRLRSLPEGVLHVRETGPFKALRRQVDALDGVAALLGQSVDVYVFHADYITGMTVKCQA